MHYLRTFGFLILSWLTACHSDTGRPQATLEAFTAALNAESKVQLIDVRTQQEYSTGHIAGSLNWDIENGDFKSNLSSLDKNRPVLVYCAVGGRSATAARTLQEAGFMQVLDLKGGIKAWKAAGQPLE